VEPILPAPYTLPPEVEKQYWQRVTKTSDCWMWTGALSGIYGQFTTQSKPKRIRVPAHTISFMLAGGNLAAGEMVRVTCGTTLCVNPSHLVAGTQADYERWSPENTAARFWDRVSQHGDGCWEWTGHRQEGGLPYGQTTYKNAPMTAHRLSWTLTNGPIPPGMLVLHHCDNPPCCRPSHHFLGTHAENSADMVSKGRQARNRGTAAGGARMTAAVVREMRARYDAGGVSTHQLAREFGFSAMPVWRCVTRRSYQDVA